ncbi:ArnT family glycosyltransferase [Haloferula sp.]|uniref:ArnT family glycosyltransferase n=1 Tax=Haloferula sp. TaxID=2497595 RepID=UPI003C793FE1
MVNKKSIGDRRGSSRVVLLFAAIAGLTVLWFTRLDGLGDRPLSRDEYYSASAVQKVLEYGEPAFYGGGHYPRALSMQYGTAVVCKMFGENERNQRMLPALFGILLIPLFYFFSRQFLPLWLALAVSVMFALSSWQIEFSRFARMYTALQFFTLAFFYSYYLAFNKGKTAWRYVPHLMALAAISLHDLGVLLMPFLLVAPWIPSSDGKRAQGKTRGRLAFAAVVTGGLAFAWLVFCRIWWNSGVVDPLPADWVPASGGKLERLSGFVQIPGVDPLVSLLGFATLVTGSVVAIAWRFRRSLGEATLWIGVAVMVIASIFHLFALAAVAFGFLIWRHDFHLMVFKRPAMRWSLVITGICAVAWVVVALKVPALTEGIGGESRAGELRKALFGFPDFYRPGLSPWLKAMPVFTIIAILSGFYELWRIRKEPLNKVIWNPVWVVAVAVMAFGVTGTPLSVTRYWFFVFPFIFILPALALNHLGGRFIKGGETARGGLIPATALIVLMAITEEFNLRHLVATNSHDVVYRTGEFQKFSRHWYPRSDEELPAIELGQHAAPGTSVILSSMLTASVYYLPEGLKPAVYMRKDLDPRFARHSRKGGTMDRWSGLQLLTCPADLDAYTSETSRVILARVVKSRFQDLEPEEIWAERLVSSKRIALSRDGRNEVLEITLRSRQL